MNLPIMPPYPPMEALLVDQIPSVGAWQYEPKWDGFRCLAFRDGDEVYLQSKSGRSLARYFPDAAASLKELSSRRFILDGEIVIPVGEELSFEELQLRLHPAASRVAKLAAAHQALYIVFDLLLEGSNLPLADRPLSFRRRRLEEFFEANVSSKSAVHLSPATTQIELARHWFARAGRGTDGIVVKRLDMDYRSGERTGMQKIKNIRTTDCVVGGFRYATHGRVIGSLLLGLYDEQGLLNHVGFTSSLDSLQRRELTPRLEKLRAKAGAGAGFTGTAPGGPSRWSTDRTGQWEPLPPELVVEVTYDHFSGGRFRHGTHLLRWRPDKLPEDCTMDQVQQHASGLWLLKPSAT